MKSADRFEEALKQQQDTDKIEIFINGEKVVECSSIMAGVITDKETGQIIIAGRWSPNEASELMTRMVVESAKVFVKGGRQREDN